MTVNFQNAQPTADFIANFWFDGRMVRTAIGADGMIWFCAQDVCKVLGLAIDQYPFTHLSDHVKSLLPHSNTPDAYRELTFMHEGATFLLVYQSGKPISEADRFAVWLTDEVLKVQRAAWRQSQQIAQSVEV